MEEFIKCSKCNGLGYYRRLPCSGDCPKNLKDRYYCGETIECYKPSFGQLIFIYTCEICEGKGIISWIDSLFIK